jgi:CDP-diacylglycerol--glycerol-3-phosphate 3-phosphatidyltransferase
MLDTKARKFFDPLFDKLANTFIKYNIKPNQITTLSLIIGLLSAISYYFDYIILSILLLWISGLFDVLDGTVSRKTNSSSLLGTLYDIVFDRIVELSILFSIA